MVEYLDATEPLRVIDNETFTDRDWLTDSVITETITQLHEATYALQRPATHLTGNEEASPDPEDDRSPSLILSTSLYDLCIRGPSTEAITPASTGVGFLVRIPNRDVQTYWDVVETANAARFTIGSWVNERSTIDDDVLRTARTQLTLTLYRAYLPDIASWSPPPYGPLAERLRDSSEKTNDY